MISPGHGFSLNSWLCLLLTIENYCSNHGQGGLHGCKLAAVLQPFTLPGPHHAGKRACLSANWTERPGKKSQQMPWATVGPRLFLSTLLSFWGAGLQAKASLPRAAKEPVVCKALIYQQWWVVLPGQSTIVAFYLLFFLGRFKLHASKDLISFSHHLSTAHST